MKSSESNPSSKSSLREEEDLASHHPREYRLFWALDDDGDGRVRAEEVAGAIKKSGLTAEDPRLEEVFAKLESLDSGGCEFPGFLEIIQTAGSLIERVLQGQLALPDFELFASEIEKEFRSVEENEGGEQATYIPPLAEVDPDQYALAAVSVDGQVLELGDCGTDFSVQSACKPFNYCFAMNELGEERVHKHIGMEPSGQAFNARVLMGDGTGRPHNPMINAGAIMAAALIQSTKPVHRRLDHVREMWGKMTGGSIPRFNAWMASEESRTGDNNRALGYMMKAAGVLPNGEDAVDHELRDALELYFSACSLEMNVRELASAAATLANRGVCPTTRERVFDERTVRNCLTLMQMCGMYDGSGEFSVNIGLPAKSGVGGAVFVVIPGLMGVCTWSPRLDAIGNSVRGVEMAMRLTRNYRLHLYDGVAERSERRDPRVPVSAVRARQTSQALQAATIGDIRTLKWLANDDADLEKGDYDLRTPLHLAAAEGNLSTVQFLLDCPVGANPRDRWGNTPLDDAEIAGHQDVAGLLKKSGGENGDPAHPSSGSTATQEAAAHYGDTDSVVELLWAAADNDLDGLRRCVARGIPLSAADYDGRTALHLAASNECVEAVQYLLSHDHPVLVRDRWGATPLDDARREKREAVVDLLAAAEEAFHVLAIDSRLDEMPGAARFVEHYTAAYSLGGIVGHRINTVLDDVLDRIVSEACGGERGHEIKLEFKLEGDSLQLVITDDGEEFDPLSTSSLGADAEESLMAEASLKLIQGLTTSAKHSRRKDSNVLTLSFATQ